MSTITTKATPLRDRKAARLRSLRMQIRLHKSLAKIASANAVKSDQAKQTAERRADALFSVNVRRESLDMGNIRTTCVRINAQLYRQSPESFHRLIMEEVPRQIIDHLRKNPP